MLWASKAMRSTASNDSESAGTEIVRRTLIAPAKQIVANAGADAAPSVGKILEADCASYGYSAQIAQYGDTLVMGIVNPVKVVRTVLQDAASVARL